MKCLDRNPETRWSAKRLVDHPWLIEIAYNYTVDDTELRDIGINFYQFKRTSQLQSLFLEFLVTHKAKQDEIEKLATIFTQIDENKNGYLEHDEIQHAFEQF